MHDAFTPTGPLIEYEHRSSSGRRHVAVCADGVVKVLLESPAGAMTRSGTTHADPNVVEAVLRRERPVYLIDRWLSRRRYVTMEPTVSFHATEGTTQVRASYFARSAPRFDALVASWIATAR
jgi:hypothetical protein